MPPAFDPSTPTTELEAVNTMLAAIGQPPLPPATDLATATEADVQIAVNTLWKASREVLTGGWRFNTLFGFQLEPLGITPVFQWTEVGTGLKTDLNIFSLSSLSTGPKFLSWKLSNCVQNGDLDMIERQASRTYTGFPATLVVLYDRTHNRDGAAKDRHPYIYLDGIIAMNFEEMPEVARRYIAIRAARQFSQQVVGNADLRMFTEKDEYDALRILKRDQGLIEKHNLMDNYDGYMWHGGRPTYFGMATRRVFRGGF